MIKSSFLTLCLGLSSMAHGRDYFVSSYSGGYLGFLSLGTGLVSEGGKYSGEGILGYVPSFVGGEDLWSLTLRGDYSFAKIEEKNMRFYSGIGIIQSFDKDTFIFLPKRYPKGYYPSTGLFFAPYLGVEWLFKENEALTFEITTLDFYLELYARNSSHIRLREIINYGIGYRFHLPSGHL